MKAAHLRIATYNLQKCVGLDLRRRPDRSLAVIDAIGADLVVLQEADKRLPPRPAALPHEMIEEAGWHILPFGAPGGSLGWHGNAMLARTVVTVRKTKHLELPGLEPRGAVCADLETSIGSLRVVGLHLGLVRRYRQLQVAAILRAVSDLPEMPLLISGDFNEWGDPKGLGLTSRGLQFAATKPSFPALRPVARLDRFALSPELRILRTGVHSAQPAHVASDHLPVWADVASTLAPDGTAC